MIQPVIGIIGGSGLYDIDGLEDKTWRRVETPWGDRPTNCCSAGWRSPVRVPAAPRTGHPTSPTHLNYRANIDALKRSGVTDVLSLSAVGSLKADLPPGHFVIVDQFIDRSFAREKSFFGDGIVAHVSMAHPVCTRLGDALQARRPACRLPVTRGGTYLVMEGPQFSTKAESELYRGWGCSVIGMTNMPEAKLAREAELCYATVAMVTDFDCWHPDHDHVTVEAVVQVLLGNADKARGLVQAAVPNLGRPRDLCPCGCDRALDNAVITAPRCATRRWPPSCQWLPAACWDSWSRFRSRKRLQCLVFASIFTHWRPTRTQSALLLCRLGVPGQLPRHRDGLPDFLRRRFGGTGAKLHAAVRLRHGDRLDLHRHDALVLRIQLIRDLGGEIDHAAFDVGPAVLDLHGRGLAVVQVRHPGDAAQRQGLAGGDVGVRVHPVAVGHRPVGEMRGVERPAPRLRTARAIDLPGAGRCHGRQAVQALGLLLALRRSLGAARPPWRRT